MEVDDPDVQCECTDPSCTHPIDDDLRCLRQAIVILHRVDIHDHSGNAFCESCAEEALDGGMFYDSGDEG